MSYERFGLTEDVELTARMLSCGGAPGSPVGTFVQPLAAANEATWYEMPNADAPLCSVALTGAASTPRVEKKFAKSTVGPANPRLLAWMPPTQSTWATFLP